MGFFAGNVDLTSPGPIGSTTPNTGAFTTLSASSTLTVKVSTGLTDRSITALGTTSGMSFDSSNGYVLTANQYAVRFNRGGDAGVTIRSDSAFGITSGNADGTIDTVLRRDAADTFAQRRSTNAQTFRLYNTFTDASNYERGFFRWNTNVLEIGAEAAGTGTQRTISFLGGSNNSAISFTSNSLNAIFGNNANIFYKNIQSEASIRFSGGDLGISRNAAGVLEVNNTTAGTFRDLIIRNLRMSAPTLVPASASATGSEGQISWDASYIYVCTATNTWKRTAIATW